MSKHAFPFVLKKILSLLVVVAGLVMVAVIVVARLTPWMDRWGATEAEIAATLTGDELVPDPAGFYNHAVSINARPEQIFPWLVQLGAEKGGWYSYTFLEALLGCSVVNADRIHTEWQNIHVGDTVKMCPQDPPPPYRVAQVLPNEALVLGHQDQAGQWAEVWQLVLRPQANNTTRLIVRTRTMMVGGFWDVIHPGVFIMERGMLLGIKVRAEKTDLSALPLVTPTPEIFNSLRPSPTPPTGDLPLTCQITDLGVYVDRAAGYCFAYPQHFTLGAEPSDRPTVFGPAIGNGAESVQAMFTVEVSPLDSTQSLNQQVDAFLPSFTTVDPASLTRAPLIVGGEAAVLVEAVPARLNWRLVFVPHNGQLYRLRYGPMDVPEAHADVEELYQTTFNSFAFVEAH